MCRHKLEDGNCVTDEYVERKVSDLVRENEELKAALEEERKSCRRIRGCPEFPQLS